MRLSLATSCVIFLTACGSGGGDGAEPSDVGGDAATDGAGDVANVDVGADVGDALDGDGGTAALPLYPGCPSPSSTFARTIYVDPKSGADTGDGSATAPFHTLASAFAQKKIQAGDHVVLLPGDHGVVQVTKYDNPSLVGATAWTWLDFHSGATVQMLSASDMSSWLITHAEVTALRAVATPALVSFNASTNMILVDAHLYSIEDASAWTASNWIDDAADGIGVRNGSCVALVRDKLVNTRFGISISSDNKTRPDTSMKVLALGNEVAGFSGDAMRVVASDVTVQGNYLHDVYVSAADGDDNHDDALQMWALNGATFDDIRIDGNWVQETTDATRPLQNELQGIDDFDGVNTNVVVTNNVVLASAYHGISLYGAQDSTIDHNTVANPTSNGHKTWIMVNDTKAGAPSKNLTVTNNAATSFSVAADTIAATSTNDVTVPDPTAAYTTFDLTKLVFDLTPKSGSVLDGKGAGSSQIEPPPPLP